MNKTTVMKFLSMFTLLTFLFSVPVNSTEIESSVGIDAGDISLNPSSRLQPGNGASLPFEGRTLSLDECVNIALERNPTGRFAAESVNIAGENVGETRSAFSPQVGLNGGYGRWQKHAFLPDGLTRPGTPTVIGPTDDWTFGVVAQYTLFDGGERNAKLDAATANREAAINNAETTRMDIILNVHIAYYTLIGAMEAQSVAEGNLERTKDHLALAGELENEGVVPHLDVVRAEVVMADAELALVKARNAVRVSRGNLNTAMGLPVETEISVSTESDPAENPENIDISASLENAVDNRPELTAARLRVDSTAGSINAANSAFSPRVKTDLGLGFRGSEFDAQDEEWSVRLMVEYPLFDGKAREHRVSGARATHAREESTRDRLVLGVRQEVWSAYSKLIEAYESIHAANVLVSHASESLETERERYAAGVGTMNDLLDAQNAFNRAEGVRVRAEWDYRVAYATFNRTIGDMEK